MFFTANHRRQANAAPAITDSDAICAEGRCARPTVSKRSLLKKSRAQECQDHARYARPLSGRAFSFGRP